MQLSKKESIIILAAVLFFALFTHMLVGCRQNFLEGMNNPGMVAQFVVEPTIRQLSSSSSSESPVVPTITSMTPFSDTTSSSSSLSSSSTLANALVSSLPSVAGNNTPFLATQTTTSLTQPGTVDSPAGNADDSVGPVIGGVGGSAVGVGANKNLSVLAAAPASTSQTITTPNPFAGLSTTPLVSLAAVSSIPSSSSFMSSVQSSLSSMPLVSSFSSSSNLLGNIKSSLQALPVSSKNESFTNNDSFASAYWNNDENEDFFANTKFKPECCQNSNYSTSTGCACLSKKQENYVEQRGDNNSGMNQFYFF